MKKYLLYPSLVAALCLFSVGCVKKDKIFDSAEEVNPRVREANYVDKVNAFKLYIPPGVWRVVRSKKVKLALENRKCSGKVMVDAEWSTDSELADEARTIADDMLTENSEWPGEKETFVVEDCPAVVVAARGKILYARAEKFYVERTVAVGIIKFGARECIFKYVVPQECYARTRDDLVNLMRGFRRLERSPKGEKASEDDD